MSRRYLQRGSVTPRPHFVSPGITRTTTAFETYLRSTAEGVRESVTHESGLGSGGKIHRMPKAVKVLFENKDHERLTTQRKELGLDWGQVIPMGLELLMVANNHQGRRKAVNATWAQVMDRGLRALELEHAHELLKQHAEEASA